MYDRWAQITIGHLSDVPAKDCTLTGNREQTDTFLDIFISSFIFAKQTTYNFSLKCLKDVTVKMKKGVKY